MIRVFLLVLLFIPLLVCAQEEQQTVYYGKKYLEINLHKLEKYQQRVARQQDRLLRKLCRKEKRLYRQLEHKDSAAYARLTSRHMSYDSIRHLLHADSSTRAARLARKGNKTVDSLRAVEQFVNGKAQQLNTGVQQVTSYTGRLDALQTDLNYQQYIGGLIDQENNSIKGLSASNVNIPVLQGLQKEVAYGKSKISEYRQMADDPSLAEEKALEWLQGTEGFDKALSGPGGKNSLQGASSADDLEKMGFQTKRQLNAQLQQKFGNNLGQVQQQMGGQISQWQDKTQGIGSELKQAQADIKEASQSLKNSKKPVLKLNPMRGLPFWKRIEKQYNFQTSRPAPDGKPAMLQLAGMAGLKHTPSLSYGVGVAFNMGLGQNWSNIRFTFEGLSLRSYATWKLFYGIGLYGGYERMYKQVGNWQLTSGETTTTLQPTTHNTRAYNESVLLGLTKQYRLNSKWNGAIQLLYDFWWRDKGLNSPVVLRFVTISKY